MGARTRPTRLLLALVAVVLGASLLTSCRLQQATEVDAGFLHSCAVVEGGRVSCWGYNTWGQLGDGTSTHHRAAVDVQDLPPATQVSVAGDHSCALLVDGTVRCWGRNRSGQLGGGTEEGFSRTPVEVVGLADVAEISAGWDHTCALRLDGTVLCWGDGSAGQLGDGSTGDSATPVVATGLTDAVGVSAGTRFTCAVRGAGTVACWGATQSPEAPVVPFPITLPGVTGASDVSSGGGHACALLSGGAAMCWGGNFFGQLGDGSTSDHPLGPVAVAGLDDAVEVDAGDDHTCARHEDGSVSCWGLGNEGQLGDGTTTTTGDGPAVVVGGLDDATSLSGGYRYTCARRASGHVTCWGKNDWGQVGGDGTPVLTPRDVLVTPPSTGGPQP